MYQRYIININFTPCDSFDYASSRFQLIFGIRHNTIKMNFLN